MPQEVAVYDAGSGRYGGRGPYFLGHGCLTAKTSVTFISTSGIYRYPSSIRLNHIHRRISQLGATAETLVSTYEINTSVHFSAIRRHIRDALFATSEGCELNDLVIELIG